MASIPGVYGISDSLKLGKRQLEIDLTTAGKAARLNPAAIEGAVRGQHDRWTHFLGSVHSVHVTRAGDDGRSRPGIGIGYSNPRPGETVRCLHGGLVHHRPGACFVAGSFHSLDLSSRP